MWVKHVEILRGGIGLSPNYCIVERWRGNERKNERERERWRGNERKTSAIERERLRKSKTKIEREK